jgi:NagD protein
VDGVIYHRSQLLPGAKEYVTWLQKEGKRFVFLTNSSERTPEQLSKKLEGMGIQVESSHFYTSALATALYLSKVKRDSSAFVIGEPALVQALEEKGIKIASTNVDWVVLGDIGHTKNYDLEKIEKAVDLVLEGALLIGTSHDIKDRVGKGFVPATGALIKPIEMTTGAIPFFLGKPNPLIMRQALQKLGTRLEDTVIIGDRLDTDILAGIQTEISTVLVLSGVSSIHDVKNCGYQPDCVASGVEDLLLATNTTFSAET